MDFALRTLSDAFRGTAYRAERGQFKLFAFLLATPADDGIFPDLLMHAEELHHLTGREILIVCPEVHARIRGERASPEQIMAIFRSGLFPQWLGGNRETPQNVSRLIQTFMRDQTRETYQFLKYLGEGEHILPAIVFFDTLHYPTKYIVWSLAGATAGTVVKEFRQLYAILDDACHWSLQPQLSQLRAELAIHVSEPPEVRRLEYEQQRLRAQLAPARLLELWENLDLSFRRACDLPGRNFPVSDIGEVIQALREDPRKSEPALSLRRYRRRWKMRLTPDFKEAVVAFLQYVERHPKISFPPPGNDHVSLAAKLKAIDEQAAAAREIYRQQLERKIETLQAKAKDRALAPLDVLHSFDERLFRLRSGGTGGRMPPWEIPGGLEQQVSFREVVAGPREARPLADKASPDVSVGQGFGRSAAVRRAVEVKGVVFEQLLGRGGFAEVWRVRFRELPRALRVCLNPVDDTPHGRISEQERSTLREIMAIPELLNISGFIEELPLVLPGDPPEEFFVTVWQLATANLAQWWRSEESAGDEKRLLTYFAQVAAMIDLLNHHGFHHRDVKAENILLAGAGDIARLCDLGLAKRIGLTTYRGTVVKTPGHAPPEMEIHGESHPTGDLYSLAASYVQLKARIHPQEFLDRIQRAETPPGMHAAEVWVVASALHPEAERRPRDGAVAWVRRIRSAIGAGSDWEEDQKSVTTEVAADLGKSIEERPPSRPAQESGFHDRLPPLADPRSASCASGGRSEADK